MSSHIQVLFDKNQPYRLDKYLIELNLQELYSRSFIEKLINEDRILVNFMPVKKSYQLSKGDMITVNLPEPQPIDVIPQNIPLDIVYEDDNLAIINKPAGIIVHPGFGNPDNTIANAIVFHYGDQLTTDSSSTRPGIVHRLDRGTSGLMIIAKNNHAQSIISDMFSKRQIKKTYLAITTGVPDPPQNTIETYISRSLSNPRKMCVSDAGKWALTHYEILKYYHFFALCKVELETGRMHQIRVHFAHLNYPILGDLLYNSIRQVQAIIPENMKKKAYDWLMNKLHHQALHSWRLQFENPFTKKEMDLYALPPEDFLMTLQWLDQFFNIDNSITDINLLQGMNVLKETEYEH